MVLQSRRHTSTASSALSWAAAASAAAASLSSLASSLLVVQLVAQPRGLRRQLQPPARERLGLGRVLLHVRADVGHAHLRARAGRERVAPAAPAC